MSNNLTPMQRIVRDLVLIRAVDDQNVQECGVTHPDPGSDDNEVDITAPVMEKFISECGLNCVKEMTGFTYCVFNIIYDPMEVDLHSEWYAGRGRKMTTTPKDSFFIMMAVFHTYASWEHHRLDFRMSA